MKETYIEEKMRELAEDRGITAIAGRERGSRMIGVAHDDSDWDAFLLFAQPAEEYATLSGYRDTVSKKFTVSHRVTDTPNRQQGDVRYDDGDIDIHGWNVQKFGKLAQDSNPNAVEFLMSSNEYFNELEGYYGRDILSEIEEDVRANFNHMALYHHYLSLARSNYEKYVASGNDCTYNRMFYVQRATMMAKHIRKEGTFPALDVWEFLDQTDALENGERKILERLSERKQNGKLGEGQDLVGDFLDWEDDADMEPTDERINQPSQELLNDLIRQSL